MNDQQMMMVALTVFILALAVASIFTKHWNDMKMGIWEKTDGLSPKKKDMAIAVKSLALASMALLACHVVMAVAMPDSKFAMHSGAVLVLAGVCALTAFTLYAVEFTQKEPVKITLGISAYGMLAVGILSILHGVHVIVTK